MACNKTLFSQCDLTTQIEPVQAKATTNRPK